MADVDREELGALLSAYLDGEVTAEEAGLVERVIAENEAARQLLEELRGTAQLVSSLPVHAAPKSIAEDLQFHAERSELLGDPDEAPQIGGPGRLSSLSRLAVAAMLAVIVLGGWWFSVGPGAGVPPEIGPRLADTYGASKGSPTLEFDDVSETAVRRGRGKVTPVNPVPGGKKRVAELGDRGDGLGTVLVSPNVITPGKEAVIVAADLDHKFATLPMTSLRHHRFEGERLRLRIEVRNEAQGDALIAQLTSRLEQNHVIDRTDRQLIISREGESSENFYYRGEAGRNFDEADQHQLLVRAPAWKINGLMDELGRVPGVKDGVTLVVDSRSINGLDDARRALRGLSVQSEEEDEEAGESGPTDAAAAPPAGPKGEVEVIAEGPAGKEESPGPLFVDLLEEMFGLNLGVFAPAPKPPLYGPLREEPESETLAVAPRRGKDAKEIRFTFEGSSAREAVPAVGVSAKGDDRETTLAARGARAHPTAIAALTKRASIEEVLGEQPGLVERRLRALMKKSATGPPPGESGPAGSVPGAGRAGKMRALQDAPSDGQEALPVSAERLVTLVVEVSITQAKAAKGKPVKPPPASPESDTKTKPPIPAKR